MNYLKLAIFVATLLALLRQGAAQTTTARTNDPGIKGTTHEFEKGTLHSGSKKGPKVRSRKQATAVVDCIYYGGYPWRANGCLHAEDLDAAIASALAPPSSLQPGVAATNLGSASGDVTGPWSSLRVTGLQGYGISPTAPVNGQQLIWNAAASKWTPTTNTLLQHAATNADLALVSTLTAPQGIWRDDYATGIGAPPLFFRPQTGACAANSMVNDGGSCVNSSDGNSWKAAVPSEGTDVREWGADTTGTIDATVPTQACLNAVGYGGVCRVNGSVTILGNLTIPLATTLDCHHTFPDVEGNGTSASRYASLPAIKLDGTKTISAGGDSAAISRCLIYRNGMTFPIANDSLFTGTAVSSAGFNSFSITDTQVIGFDTCVNTYGGNRVYAQHVYVDCSGVSNAAFYGGNNGDIGYYSHIKAQPLSGGSGGSPAGCGIVRRGTGFKLNLDQAQFIDDIESIFWTTGISFVGGSSTQQHSIGKLWADFPWNIGCARGTSVGLAISTSSNASFLHFNHVVVAGHQTGVTINGVDPASDTTFDYLFFGAIGQDGIQLGTAAPTSAGHITFSNLIANGATRYAINLLDTVNTTWLDVRGGVIQSVNGGVAPYINLPAGLLRSNIHILNSIKADDPARIISPPTVSCTGIGATGTCSFVASAIPAPLSGVIALSVAGATPAASGTATITFPSIGQNNAEGCTAMLRDGSGVWPITTSLKSSAVAANQPTISWNTNGSGPLVAGNSYWINFACTLQ